MKRQSTLVVVPIVLLALGALAGAAPQTGGKSGPGTVDMHHEQPASAKPGVARQLKGKQTATVLINGGYSPEIIEVVSGKPVELTFTGGPNLGCGGTVVFKSLKISKDVKSGKSIIVRFTPKRKGNIPFTCGMGMYKGTVIVK